MNVSPNEKTILGNSNLRMGRIRDKTWPQVRPRIIPYKIQCISIFRLKMCPIQALDKCVNKNLFSSFSNKTNVVGTQKNRLDETVLLSTQNKIFN